jgi:hypothetical protein
MPHQWFPTAPSSVKRRTRNIIEVQVKATPTGRSPIPPDDDGAGAVPSPSPRLHQDTKAHARRSTVHGMMTLVHAWLCTSLDCCHYLPSLSPPVNTMPICMLPCIIKGTPGPLAKDHRTTDTHIGNALASRAHSDSHTSCAEIWDLPPSLDLACNPYHEHSSSDKH